MTQLECMRCGDPRTAWLLTIPLDPDDAPVGRLLHYCTPCREQAPPTGAVLPISVLDWDHEAVMRLLYGAGLTRSAPDIVQEHLQLPAGRWLDEANRLVSQAE